MSTRHMLRTMCWAVLGLAGPATTYAGGAGAERVTAIVHAGVIPMDADRTLHDHTVVVRDGVIAAVGPSDLLPAPPGALVIDADGRCVLPGLADMHVHAFEPHMRLLFVAHGVTTVRHMWGTPASLEARRRGALPPGDDPHPTMITAGPITDGVPPIWRGSVGVADAAAAAAAVRSQADAGYDFVKTYSKLSPEAFHAIAETCGDLGMRFGGHIPRRVPLAEAAAAGMWSNEHLTGYLKACQGPDSPYLALDDAERAKLSIWRTWILLDAGVDPAAYAEAARVTRMHGLWNCPTLIVNRRMELPDEDRAAFAEHEQMRYVSASVRSFWNPANDFRMRDRPEEDRAQTDSRFQRYLDITLALHEAGCGLVAGSDTPNPYVFPGHSLHEELGLLVRAGLTPYEALRTATVNPARMLDQEGVFGLVAPGRRADLVLLRRSPLDDIAATHEIDGVMLRGRWSDRAALDALLDRAAAMANDPLHAYRDALAGQLEAAAAPGATPGDLNAAAWSLLMLDDDPDLRDPHRALALATEACAAGERTGAPNLSMYLDTLARAQHLTGDSAAAVETQRRALGIVPDRFRGPYLERLAEYEAAVGADDDD